MMLTELTGILAAALPVQALKDHLRLGTGFSDDAMQDQLLESYLRAAIAAIEGRIGKVILQRSFRLSLQYWRSGDEQPLPLAPVTAISAVRLIDLAGGATDLAAERYRLVADLQRPKLVAVGMSLPTPASGGSVEVDFDAGFGLDWPAVPVDLAQAVLLLAAEFYENRHDQSGRSFGLPVTVQMLIEPWRTVRVLGGASA